MRPAPLLLLLAPLAVAACTPEPDPAPAYYPPDAPGPHPIGTLDLHAPSQAGIDLPVQVWLPAADSGGGPWSYGGLVEGAAPEWSTPDCSEPWPVLLFSHGNGGVRFQSFSVAEFFASHGWLVAAPDHVDNTAFDMVDDWPRIAVRRPLDIADTFDWLIAESDDSGSRLAGCVDPSAGYAVMGHSFGGFTTFAVAGASLDMEAIDADCASSSDPDPGCDEIASWLDEHPGERLSDRSDPRAWAAVPWAPAWHEKFGGSIGDIEVPTLVIGADRDDLTPWDGAVEPAYRELTVTPRYLAGLLDAGHYSFTDICGILPEVLAENGCSDGFRDFTDVLVTTRVLSMAFLRTVQGDEQAADWLPPESGVATWEGVEP